MADDWKDERVNELGRRRLRPLPVDLYCFPEDWGSDRVIRHGLTEILTKQRTIMADISKLQASVTQLQLDVAALVAKPSVPSQAEVDAVQASVDAIDTSVKAAIGQ